MKFIILAGASLLSFSAFACLEGANGAKICVDDIVYNGDLYPHGARVVAVDKNLNKARVGDIYYGYDKIASLRDLAQTSGCLQGICVRDQVVKGSIYPHGGKVIAINKSKKTITVKDIYYGSINNESARDLDVTYQSSDFEKERNL